MADALALCGHAPPVAGAAGETSSPKESERKTLKQLLRVRSFYEILEVEPGATLQDIKKAWKLVALLYHPDKGDDSETSTRYLPSRFEPNTTAVDLRGL